MLELHVVPERNIGNEKWEFVLGMYLTQAIRVIKSQVSVIKGVKVVYCDSHPDLSDVIVDLTQDGIRLHFDSASQRLKTIDVYVLSKVKLKYCGAFFNNEEVLPTTSQINKIFGATEPQVFNEENHCLTCQYRGISFIFPLASDYEVDVEQAGLNSVTMPSTKQPVASRMVIYSGNSYATSTAPELPAACFYGNIFSDEVEVLRDGSDTQGLRIHVLCEAPSGVRDDVQLLKKDKHVYFGDSPQEVISLLGNPCKVFFKPDNKMRIHSTSPYKNEMVMSDYFFNYFTLGLDILFDATCNTVKKFVLHTNFPGHYDFEMYNRCNFAITIDSTMETDMPGVDLDNGDSKLVICPTTKWEEFCGLQQPADSSIVLSRNDSTNTTNIFRPSMCYNVQNMIFEIVNGHSIATVTLYPSESAK